MDNVIEALGKGKNKKGKGLKEIKNKVVDFAKKHRGKIATVVGALGTIGAITALANKSQRRRAQPRQQLPLFIPFSGPGARLPLRPGGPARPAGAGLKEVKDNVVNFVKKHKGKIATAAKTAAKIAALAAIYKNSDKIIDYVDKTKLGQTQIGQNILGNLGYAQGHVDVYKGILQHLFNKYRRDVLGFGVC